MAPSRDAGRFRIGAVHSGGVPPYGAGHPEGEDNLLPPPSSLWEYGESSSVNESSGVNAPDGEPLSPKWEVYKNRRWRRKDLKPKVAPQGCPQSKAPLPPTATAIARRDAYMKRIASRCFRCLARDHKIAQCRDRIRCLQCDGVGHIASQCPSRRHLLISKELHSRLTFPPENIHSRISFPELPPKKQAPDPPSSSQDMERTPGQAAFRPALGRVAVVATDAMAAEAGRLLVHVVTVSVQPGGYSPSSLEVAYAFSVQLQVPRHSFRVTRLTSVSFVADFKVAPARDRAVLKGFITISGSHLPIRPWRSAGGGTERAWWFHMKLTMENVPLEAWNEDGIKLLLGDSCTFDRFDSNTAAEDRETSQFLTCWVWMEQPGNLPRAVEYWFFEAWAGQAMEIIDLPMRQRFPSMPPVGKFGDKTILIHLDGYEDWCNYSSDSGSSSGHGNSGPEFIPFAWSVGVLDGRPPLMRPVLPHVVGCRDPAIPQHRHDHDHDGDRDGQRHHYDVPRSTKVRQLLTGCASDRSVRVQSRSPHPYRRAAEAPAGDGPGRGRAITRSPGRGGRTRDAIPRASEEWERRRSRSPVRQLMPGDDDYDFLGPDPQAVPRDAAGEAVSRLEDPMLLEAYLSGVGVTPPGSSVYVPMSQLWRSAPGRRPEEEIIFGLGV